MFSKGILILFILATLFTLLEVTKAEVKKSNNELQNDSYENGRRPFHNGNDRNYDDDGDDEDDMKKKRSLQAISKRNPNLNELNNKMLQRYKMYKKSMFKKRNAYENNLIKRFRGLKRGELSNEEYNKKQNHGSRYRNYYDYSDENDSDDNDDSEYDDDSDNDSSDELDEKRSLFKKKRQLKFRSLQKRFRYNY